MRNIRRLIGITAVLVFVFMALGATVALAAPVAQSEDPESEVPEEGTEDQAGPCGVSQEVIEQIIDHEALDEIIADALGMTVEEFQEAKESGQHLRDLAEAQDVDLDEVKAAVDEARAEMVQQAVDDELITEEQAECILSHAGRCNKGGRGRGFGNGSGPGQAAPENTGLSA